MHRYLTSLFLGDHSRLVVAKSNSKICRWINVKNRRQEHVVTGMRPPAVSSLQPKKPELYSMLSKVFWPKSQTPMWMSTDVDNKVLLDSWEKNTLKDLFLFTMAHNLCLSLYYVLSRLNPADQPSRVLSDLDCTLSPDVWKLIDTTSGPHSIDVMALPSNVPVIGLGIPFLSSHSHIPRR